VAATVRGQGTSAAQGTAPNSPLIGPSGSENAFSHDRARITFLTTLLIARCSDPGQGATSEMVLMMCAAAAIMPLTRIFSIF